MAKLHLAGQSADPIFRANAPEPSRPPANRQESSDNIVFHLDGQGTSCGRRSCSRVWTKQTCVSSVEHHRAHRHREIHRSIARFPDCQLTAKTRRPAVAAPRSNEQARTRAQVLVACWCGRWWAHSTLSPTSPAPAARSGLRRGLGKRGVSARSPRRCRRVDLDGFRLEAES